MDAERTFTQDEVNTFVAEAKRKEREKFADYDSLKTKVADLEALVQERDNQLKAVNDTLAQDRAALDDAIKAREAADVAIMRHEVAAEKGVKAKFLQGGTREEMEAFADDLISAFPSTPQPAPMSIASTVNGDNRPTPTGDAEAWARDYLKNL